MNLYNERWDGWFLGYGVEFVVPLSHYNRPLFRGEETNYGGVVQPYINLSICEEIDVPQRCKDVLRCWEMPEIDVRLYDKLLVKERLNIVVTLTREVVR